MRRCWNWKSRYHREGKKCYTCKEMWTTGPNWFAPVLTDSNWFAPVLTDSNWFCVQTFLVFFHLVFLQWFGLIDCTFFSFKTKIFFFMKVWIQHKPVATGSIWFMPDGTGPDMFRWNMKERQIQASSHREARKAWRWNIIRQRVQMKGEKRRQSWGSNVVLRKIMGRGKWLLIYGLDKIQDTKFGFEDEFLDSWSRKRRVIVGWSLGSKFNSESWEGKDWGLKCLFRSNFLISLRRHARYCSVLLMFVFESRWSWPLSCSRKTTALKNADSPHTKQGTTHFSIIQFEWELNKFKMAALW